MNGLFCISDSSFHSAPNLFEISELCIFGFSTAIFRLWPLLQTMKAFIGLLMCDELWSIVPWVCWWLLEEKVVIFMLTTFLSILMSFLLLSIFFLFSSNCTHFPLLSELSLLMPLIFKQHFHWRNCPSLFQSLPLQVCPNKANLTKKNHQCVQVKYRKRYERLLITQKDIKHFLIPKKKRDQNESCDGIEETTNESFLHKLSTTIPLINCANKWFFLVYILMQRILRFVFLLSCSRFTRDGKTLACWRSEIQMQNNCAGTMFFYCDTSKGKNPRPMWSSESWWLPMYRRPK